MFEEHGIVRIGECRIEVGGVARKAELPRHCRDLVGIAADQDRVGHHPVAIRQRHAALLADRQNRTDQVLVETHAPGDAMHDDAERLGCHVVSSRAGDKQRAGAKLKR